MTPVHRIGTPIEHRLLGILLRDPRQVGEVLTRVRGEEFPTPVLGDVFDNLCHAASRGERLTAYTVADHFPAWGIHGIDGIDPHAWSEVAGWTADAIELADSIRTRAVRVRVEQVLSAATSDLRDVGVDATTIANTAVTRLTDLLTEVSTGSAETKTLEQILQGPDGYDWLVPGLLERSDRLIVTGSEGGGKTTFLRQLAICTAAGLHPFTKRKMPPHNVLVIDAENTERQWRRTSRWILNRVLQLGPTRNPAPLLQIATVRRMDITRPADLADIHRRIDLHRPDMLMIGPLYRLYPRAITNDDDAAPVLHALDTLRDRGVALVMEAHAGKATDADGDRNMAPRGSSALLGWPEFGFGLRQLREDPTISAVVRWRGDRDERLWPDHMYRGGDLPWTPSIPTPTP